MQPLEVIIAVFAALLALIILNIVFGANSCDPCQIIITGESVKVFNCNLSPEFLEVLKDLKPYHHPTL
nr:triple gene block protein 3 [Peach chlorotic mottle virus]